ncbi:MAG: PilZ domain-containing protein [Bryobacteraceae bacterium]|nr:PilZ domain-containing protein [Bryobacteraceae bacterium]
MAGVFSVLRKFGFGKAEAKADRRRDERFALLQPVSVKILGPEKEVLSGLLLNVSAHGMRVQVERQLAVGTCIEVATSEAVLLGEVCWCIEVQDRFEAGVDIEHSLIDVQKRVLFHASGQPAISASAAEELRTLLSIHHPRRLVAEPPSDRRRETRYSISAPVRVKTIHPYVTTWGSAELWDVSRNGLGFHVSSPMVPGSQIVLASGALAIFAEVRHSRSGAAGGYFVGARISDIFDEHGNPIGSTLDLPED